MIKIENVEINGWEAAIRGARNSWASWDKSDSVFAGDDGDGYDILGNSFPAPDGTVCDIGPNDLKLLQSLSNTGRGSERKYLRFITVTCDITAPIYWWKEFDTYKIGTVANSTSTMHSIASKPFEIDDFTHEHLVSTKQPILYNQFTNEDWHEIPDDPDDFSEYASPYHFLTMIVLMLNRARKLYLEEKDADKKKIWWWQMIELLPSSYNQRRTILLNYEVLATQYKDRRNHKLDDWQLYCDWIETLPYSELITGSEKRRQNDS